MGWCNSLVRQSGKKANLFCLLMCPTQQNSYSSSHYAALWLHGDYHSDYVV